MVLSLEEVEKLFDTIVKEVRGIESPYTNCNSMYDYQKARNKALKVIHKHRKNLIAKYANT